MTDILSQATGFLQTLFLGPHNYVFFGFVGIAIIGGVLVARGFKPKTEVQEAAPGVPSAEDYARESQTIPQPEEPKEPQVGSSTSASDPEVTRRLDAIEEVLMRLSAKTDKAAIEPLLRLSEKKIPVEISGTIDGDFEIPISSLRNVKISVKQVKEDKEASAPQQIITETPPAEGD